MPPPGGGGKRGRDTKVSLPLLTPRPFLRTRLPSVARLNGGLRGLGSGRLSAYMQLSCPEFRLRGLPRITVRGHSVQGSRVLLRKTPLLSRVYPWSTRRPCGPLAFRRATEGSRGAKEGLGESRGGKGTIRCPCPLLSPPPDGGILAGEYRHSRPPQAATLRALRQGVFRLQRRAAVSAENFASALRKGLF